jgi:hypothetical protein
MFLTRDPRRKNSDPGSNPSRETVTLISSVNHFPTPPLSSLSDGAHGLHAVSFYYPWEAIPTAHRKLELFSFPRATLFLFKLSPISLPSYVAFPQLLKKCLQNYKILAKRLSFKTEDTVPAIRL